MVILISSTSLRLISQLIIGKCLISIEYSILEYSLAFFIFFPCVGLITSDFTR